MSRPGRHQPADFADADRDLADVLASLEGAVNYASWLISLIAPYAHGRILEVGAGSGTFTERLAAIGEVTAVEPSSVQFSALRDRMGDRATTVNGTLESIAPGSRFDTVVMVNVLEHIPDDVAALRACTTLLEPGGRLILWVPAFESLYGRFDAMIGHHRRYRTGVLAARCSEAGLRIVECRYANLPGFAAWWLLVRVLGRVPTAGGLATVYDRAIVPVVRRIEGRVRVPFGQSVFLVAERPPAS